MKNLGFIFTSAPHGTARGREGLDAVLATSAYSEDIQLFFIGDGVTQLVKGQQPDQILSRDYIATFKMLELYDIEQVYICQESLNERGLADAELVIDATSLTRTEISTQWQQCQRVLTY